jgi:hypothetical protein
VFGRFTALAPARRMLAHVLRVGFQGSRIEQDGCGRLVLWIPNAPDAVTAQSVVVEAQGANIPAHVELGHG